MEKTEYNEVEVEDYKNPEQRPASQWRSDLRVLRQPLVQSIRREINFSLAG